MQTDDHTTPLQASLELAFQACATLSTIASASVIISIFLTEDLAKFKKRMFQQLIVMISVCDMIGSMGSAIGFQETGTVACNFQTVSSTVFYVGSWLWTLAMTYALYYLIRGGDIAFTMTQAQVVIWLVTLIPTLLPLTTSSYGTGEDDDHIRSWCYLSGPKKVGLYLKNSLVYIDDCLLN
jgi:hypothetical protein